MRKFTLRTLLFLLTGVLSVLSVSAQTRPVSVSVINAKGKPIPGRALISLRSAPNYQHIGKSGTLTVQAFPGDSIYVTVDRYVGSIPVEASTSAVSVLVSKGRMYKAVNGKATSLEYDVYELPRFNAGKPSLISTLHTFPTLLDFVEVHYPIIRINKSDGQAYIAGISSTNRDGGRNASYPALIILDGSPQRSFFAVSEKVRPSEVTNFVVKKMDVLYGIRGAGGVIEITLKKGGE